MMATVVLDNGAGTAKVGYATDKEPRHFTVELEFTTLDTKSPESFQKTLSSVDELSFLGRRVSNCAESRSFIWIKVIYVGYIWNILAWISTRTSFALVQIRICVTFHKVVPNCVTKAKNVRTRIFIGDQIDDCKDLSGLYYLLPFQKGYLVNWDIERQVWDYLFGKDVMKVDFNETNIIVTEPYFNFNSVQEAMNEIFFEEYAFKSVLKTNPSFLSQYKYSKETNAPPLCNIVLDTGYSFSHIVPYFKGKKITGAVKRVNVGGKLLTNHLKEVISYRQLMVMDETYVINQVKEDVCYVSTQFMKDMEIAKKRGKENTIARDYVLPDYTHIKRGYVRPQEETTGKAKDGEQIIRMNNERFAIPELLFHPSDVGVQEMGVAEALVYAISTLPEEMRPHMYSNIVLTGGNCLLPGFSERFYADVRSMAPEEYDISTKMPSNPVTYAWDGGRLLANTEEYKKMAVTREQYEEHGHSICAETFDI